MGVGFPLIEVWLTLPVTGAVEITNYVRIQGDADIVITAGRDDWRSQAGPSTCRLTVDNSDGRFSPLNISGPWYGQIRRGLTLTVKAKYAPVSEPDRFVGEITELPIRWDQSGKDRFVTIVAAGISRRLNRGASRSALGHDLLAMGPASPAYPVSYWPLEGGTTAQALGSSLGQSPMSLRGVVTPGNFSGFIGSSSILTLGAGGGLDGSIPDYPNTGKHVFRFLTNMPSYGSSRTMLTLYSTGTVKKLNLIWNSTDGSWSLLGYDTAGTAVVVLNFFMGQAGTLMAWAIEMETSGSNVIFTMFQGGGFPTSITYNLASATAGKFRKFSFAPNGDMPGTSIGHAYVGTEHWSDSGRWMAAGPEIYGIYNSLIDEKADTRIKRLCAAAGISVIATQVASTDVGETMGWTPEGTLWSRLSDAAATDGGLLADSITELGLEFYSTRYLGTTAASIILDVSAGHLAKPPEPTLDDQGIITDATVTRRGGMTSRHQVTHPEGVFTTSATLNLGSDTRALPAAEWMVGVGTNTDVRIPRLAINLRRNPSLIPSWFFTRFGQRLRLTNPPVDLGPGEKGTNVTRGYEYIIQGWTERLGWSDWTVEFNLSPARPWKVGLLSATASPVLEGYTAPQITVAADTTATVLTISLGPSPTMPITTAAGDYPRNVMASTGEELTITSISAQQFISVIRSVNGVVKPLPVGTTLTLVEPFRLGR